MMTDWRAHLRANLGPLAADPAREEEIIEELAEHLAERERAAFSAGATATEARRAAWEELPDLKGLSRTIQNLDRSRPTPPPPPLAARTSAIRGMAEDVRYTLRLLRRAPGFVAAVVLTLALGIGATTAAFSLLYGVLLKPLPYPNPEQLVGVFRAEPKTLQRRSTAAALADYYSVPPVVFRDFDGSLPSFSALGAYTTNDASVRIGDRTERVASALVTSGVFRALAVPPQVGGLLTPADDRPGAPARVVLSDAFWRTRFGADPGVIGRPLTIDGVSHTITGIMPKGFSFPDGGEALWMTLDEQSRAYPARDSGFLQIVGRLRPGVTIQQARVAVEDLARRLAEQHPEDKLFAVRVFSRLDLVSAGIRPRLLLVTGAVAAVLLIACANVANLLLIRATDRRREIGLRQALGAPRGRLLSQFLVESVVLSGLGGLLGCLAAAVGLEPLVAGLPFALPRAAEIGVDLNVLGFAAILSVLVGLVIGVLPALRATGVRALDSVREAGRSPGGSLGRSRAQAALVVSEVALVFLLLTVAGLFIRSFDRLSHVDLGFDPERVLLVRVQTPAEFKQRDPRILTFLDEVAARLSAIPGVAAVGAASEIPFEGYSTPPMSVETPTGTVQEHIHSTVITPGYLRVMGMAVVAGRTLADSDREGNAPVALVSEAFVRRYWSAGNPLGRRVRIDVPVPPYSRWLTVVGVVRDVRYAAASKPIPVVYLPQTQAPQPGLAFMVKSAVPSSAIAAAVRTTVLRMNPDVAAQPVALFDHISQSNAYRLGRFAIVLFGVLAATASALAALGIYGVLAYAVARRTHEIGVRVALGASTGSVLGRFVGFGLALAGVGGAIGLVGAAAVTRTLQGLLFEVSPTDPAAIAVAALLVAVTAAAASYLPARRATRIDPWQALRSE